jgi:hypothetical protein
VTKAAMQMSVIGLIRFMVPPSKNTEGPVRALKADCPDR